VESLRFISRLSLVSVKATIETAFLRLIAPFNAKHLEILINHRWYLIAMVKWAVENPDKLGADLPDSLSHEERKKIEAERFRLMKLALSTLGMARLTVSKLPRQMVEPYLTCEWAKENWLKKHRPDVLEVLEKREEGEEWLRSQLEEIKEFLWGKPTRL